MRKYRDAPARTVLGQVLQEHFPPGWQLVEHEGEVDDSDRTRVRVSQRTISHADTGNVRNHLVGFTITITIPTENLADAEGRLDDEMDGFLYALDLGDVPWTTATKGQFGDEHKRLGYQLDVTIRTNHREEDPNGD